MTHWGYVGVQPRVFKIWPRSFPQGCVASCPFANTERAAFWLCVVTLARQGRLSWGTLCNAAAQPSLGTGRTGTCHGKGRVWRHPPPPLPSSFKNKEQLLQMLLRGVSCFPPAPSFMSCLSCASSQVMGVLSQHLVPSHCCSPAVQKQNWGLLLLFCCGNALGSPLQCLTFLLEASSSSGGEREGPSLESVPHQQGLDLLMLVFALSKTASHTANWDG